MSSAGVATTFSEASNLTIKRAMEEPILPELEQFASALTEHALFALG